MGASKFTGSLLGLLGITLLAALITLLTLGIALPWAVCIKQSWLTRHTYIEGRQLKFTGNAGQLFGQYIKWFLLIVITLGIYSLWVNLRMKAWVVSKTVFAS
jgi:uncharacterized membrane protein YjgN (DUF898 family)